MKILFRFQSDLLNQEIVETVWSLPVDMSKGYFKIDSIPFYVKSIATEDVVFAEFDEKEQMLTYRDIVEFSGNSTVQVVLLNKSLDINEIREKFNNLGCASESANDSYFAMNIPTNVDYSNIKKELDILEKAGAISYSEACLSDSHG